MFPFKLFGTSSSQGHILIGRAAFAHSPEMLPEYIWCIVCSAGAHQSRQSQTISDSAPATMTVRDLQKPSHSSCSGTQRSEKEPSQVLEPTSVNYAKTSEVVGVDGGLQSATGLQGQDPYRAGEVCTEEVGPTGFEGMDSSDDGTALEDEIVGKLPMVMLEFYKSFIVTLKCTFTDEHN